MVLYSPFLRISILICSSRPHFTAASTFYRGLYRRLCPFSRSVCSPSGLQYSRSGINDQYFALPKDCLVASKSDRMTSLLMFYSSSSFESSSSSPTPSSPPYPLPSSLTLASPRGNRPRFFGPADSLYSDCPGGFLAGRSSGYPGSASRFSRRGILVNNTTNII